ncbi:hypothetical protein Tsubulata_037709 [Turnera subulata]|uniref:Pentatricopeptide repeat-containing protein n=1 Tax=Turnera subulata TaxID=218843 RepID=A0A9Q0FHZ8_9ROSI|nr:hypothetical protein Tsubulata_037709 [Turnera subulata]
MGDVVSWTALIVGYLQNRESEKGLESLCEMHRIGGDAERPSFRTLEGGFQACGNLGASGCLHCLAVKTELEHSQVVKSSLLSMYSKCGNVQAAYHSFCEVKDKDLFSWTSNSGVYPDGVVVCCMLLGFGNCMRVSEGEAFGLSGPAQNLFSRGSEQNKESWNIMVSGYTEMGLPEKCFSLFRKIQSLCMEADPSSIVSVIFSCSRVGATYLFSSLHCQIIKRAMAEDVSIFNSLIDMYGKNGNLCPAWTIFWRTKERYCNMEYNDLLVYLEWPMEAIDLGGYELKVSLATALIDMYTKCGKLEKPRQLFNSMKDRDVSWTVMISGYGMHGDAKDATEMLNQISLPSFALLSACAHAGLVAEGKYLFDKQQCHFLEPNLKHYACMVGILGRFGDLQEAQKLVSPMPICPDGCKIHNQIEVGIQIAKRAIESDPQNDGYYIILSNVYDSIGMWEEAERAREMMMAMGVEKTAGWNTNRIWRIQHTTQGSTSNPEHPLSISYI